MSFETLVFDLDGTLVHTAPDTVAQVNLQLLDAGLEPLSEAEVISMVGDGLTALIARAFARRGDPEAERRAEARAERLLEAALQAPAPHSEVYPHASRVLDDLRRAGHRLVVCTNKTEVLARAVLRDMGLLDRLHGVVGGGALPKKPDAAPVHEAVRRAGGRIESALMIGDSATDLDAARAAGLPCVLVSYGYHHGRLPELTPDQTIDGLDELPAALARLAAGRPLPS